MIQKKYEKRVFLLSGILFTISAGTALHFLFDWSGRLIPAALIAPVNESVWEHLKLLFFPFLLFSALEALIRRPCPAFYAAGTFGQLYKGKCAAAVVCRYRSGGSAALDRLNKYITTSQMNLIGSIDYMEFHSDFSEETGRFDTKVLKKLADQIVQALSVQE